MRIPDHPTEHETMDYAPSLKAFFIMICALAFLMTVLLGTALSLANRYFGDDDLSRQETRAGKLFRTASTEHVR